MALDIDDILQMASGLGEDQHMASGFGEDQQGGEKIVASGAEEEQGSEEIRECADVDEVLGLMRVSRRQKGHHSSNRFCTRMRKKVIRANKGRRKLAQELQQRAKVAYYTKR
eukprot:12413086-Karenia_brevis.AAC.1